MKKIFLYTLVLSSYIGMAQSDEKVGINKDNPQYTLDIEGSMRIQDVTGDATGAVALAWDPKTNQVVEATQAVTERVYHIRSYKIKVEGDNRDISVENVKLGINPKKWEAMLINSFLVTEDFTYDNPDAGKAFVQLLGLKRDLSNEPVRIDSYTLTPSDAELVFTTPTSKIVQNSASTDYLFSADYPGHQAATSDKRHMWVIEVLVTQKL